MPTTSNCDIAIVGGGAAGLAAAIFAGQRLTQNNGDPEPTGRADAGRRIVVFDGAKKLGAKILVSGGGRCNVTHDTVTQADYNGHARIVSRVLKALTQQRTVDWFADMGVGLKREPTGKLFPTTDSARTVLDALLHRCNELGVTLATEHRVSDVSHTDAGQFVITHTQGTTAARCVILATGGRSLPRTGSDGQGYTIAKRLGHTVTDTWPALVPIVLDDSFGHVQLAGLSLEAKLTTTIGSGKVLDKRSGSLLWTHFGISGPVAMDASRHWLIARHNGPNAAIHLGVFPDDDFATADRWLIDQAHQSPNRTVVRVLASRLPERLAAWLLGSIDIPATTAMHQLTKAIRRTLVHALTALPLPAVRDRGWNYAEVTAGGVPLDEIKVATMGSRVRDGLFLIGELLDCDGRIGGFNFQWAWATGYLAGRAAAAKLNADD